MKEMLTVALIYYLSVAAISVFLTVYDKAAAKARKRRIPEAVLFTLAGLGGALPMLLIMKLIHHKTRHNSFMLGLPAIILLQALLVCIAFLLLK